MQEEFNGVLVVGLRLRNVDSRAEVSSSVLCKDFLSAEVRFRQVKKSALVSSDTQTARSI